MMDTHTPEQDLRREAIGRRLAGEQRKDICEDLERATSWFDKWWAEYRRNPQTDLADRSRAPQNSPGRVPTEVVQTIVSLRQTLEAAATPETRYGLIGARAIQGQLEQLHIGPPSIATIQRILQVEGLTHPLGAGQDSAFYPWPEAWAVNAIQATDIITRHVHGGEAIQNFHTIDHYTHAVHLRQHADKTSVTSSEHLLATWSKLGLPQVQQLDNEGSFCGGYTHPQVVGRVVRLCLRLWRVALSRCSHRFMNQNATIRSRPFTVSGTAPSGHAKSFVIVRMSRRKYPCSSGGITPSISHRVFKGRLPPKCAKEPR
jgi:hypothetical protein